jgi:DNA-directed RNA polymerase subunit RPC12/RpoP
MRPNVSVEESEQYECPACGKRVESPESVECECGATLRNLTNSRDL